MTGPEAKKQDQLFDFVREWREDDRAWKQDVGDRLRALEDAHLVEETFDAARSKILGMGRAGIALALSIVSGAIAVMAFIQG